MITDRSEGSEPEDESIWHYRQFPEFLSILQNQALWFSRLDCLKDPFEGRYQRSFKSNFRAKQEYFNRLGVVSCWTIDDDESELMWYAYAPHFGVAIKSTKAKLKESLKLCEDDCEDDIVIDTVKYEVPSQPSALPYTILFSKRRHFKGERELRIAIPYEYNYTHAKRVEPPNDGKLVKVMLTALIGEIWVAPNSSSWFKNMVEKELEKYGYESIPVKIR
jgi:hypothetical protein